MRDWKPFELSIVVAPVDPRAVIHRRRPLWRRALATIAAVVVFLGRAARLIPDDDGPVDEESAERLP